MEREDNKVDKDGDKRKGGRLEMKDRDVREVDHTACCNVKGVCSKTHRKTRSWGLKRSNYERARQEEEEKSRDWPPSL